MIAQYQHVPAQYFEFPVKWSHIKRGFVYGTHTGFIPNLKELFSYGKQITNIDSACNLSVCLTPKPTDVEDLRFWCKENSEDYKVLGRFGTISVEKAHYNFCKDIKFIFNNSDTAVLFKLTFG